MLQLTPSPFTRDPLVEALEAMGYRAYECVVALEKTQRRGIDEAVSWLLRHKVTTRFRIKLINCFAHILQLTGGHAPT